MTPPSIADAKDVTMKLRARGAMVLAFGAGKFDTTAYATASYGMTREYCDAMRMVNDQICDLIAKGKIVIPPVLRKEAHA